MRRESEPFNHGKAPGCQTTREQDQVRKLCLFYRISGIPDGCIHIVSFIVKAGRPCDTSHHQAGGFAVKGHVVYRQRLVKVL